jgi:hypothetical protein
MVPNTQRMPIMKSLILGPIPNPLRLKAGSSGLVLPEEEEEEEEEEAVEEPLSLFGCFAAPDEFVLCLSKDRDCV